MSGAIKTFEAAAVWLDGTALVGHIMEIQKPELTWETYDHSAVALRGIQQFASRMEAMTCTLKMADYDTTLARASSDPFKAVTLQIREAYGLYRAGSRVSTSGNIVTLRGRFLSFLPGTITHGNSER